MLRIAEADRQKDTGRHTDRQTDRRETKAGRRSGGEAGAAGRREQRGSKSNRDAGDGLSVWLLAVWIRSI